MSDDKKPKRSNYGSIHHTEKLESLQESRRDFLKTIALTSAGACIPMLGHVSSARGDSIQPNLDDALVSMVRRSSVETMVRDAIEMAGGLGDIMGGDQVLIKPNIMGTSIPPAITNPQVVRTVIQAIKTRTASQNITVADCCAFGLSTRDIATLAGIVAICEKEGVNFMAWDEEPWEPFMSDKWQHIQSEREVPQSLMSGQFEHFINVPVLKNHEMVPGTNVDYTCCMKNLVGTINYASRGFVGGDSIHTQDLGDKAAELGMIVPKITMNLVDATTITLTNGPCGLVFLIIPALMQQVSADLILASKDRVACDSLAVAVLKHYAKKNLVFRPYRNKSVWEQAQIMRGSALGLGVADPAHIDIVTDGVGNIDSIMDEWV